MPPKKRKAKVAALENEAANLKYTLVAMQSKTKEHQENLMKMLVNTKDMEKLPSSS